MSFKKKALASAIALAAAGAMIIPAAASPAAAASTYKICVYTHGDGGTFWSVFQKGAVAAAKKLGVKLDYQGSSNDAAKQASTISAGIAAGCQGLATSVPDPAAIKTAVAGYVKKGIPFVTVNSGSDVSQSLGAFTHIGQDETIAGQQAGLRFNKMGLKHILCPIQEAANIGLQARCKGLKQTFKGKVTNFNADGALSDLTAATQKIQAALSADKTYDGVFALNADVAAKAVLPAVKALKAKIKIGTVDMSPEALADIKAGTISFAIDQQQYAQGYMAVVLLYLALNNGNQLGGGQAIYTGPGFVTKDNVAKVISLVAAGTR
ncbi:MAG: sugar ABC transporter substrate-binding protein [Phenylobacterium zucineum]|nr:MAG: sugar ABC transporter substrate-binding protein [Phenylobacterium zucineum]